MDKVRCCAVHTDTPATAFAWYDIGLKTCAVGVVYHLHPFACVYARGIHKVFVNGYGADIFEICFSHRHAVNLRFQYLQQHFRTLLAHKSTAFSRNQQNNLCISKISSTFARFPVQGSLKQVLLSNGCFEGKMAEWSIAAVLKTVDLQGFGGSNPSLSAKESFRERGCLTDVGNLFYVICRDDASRVVIDKDQYTTNKNRSQLAVL